MFSAIPGCNAIQTARLVIRLLKEEARQVRDALRVFGDENTSTPELARRARAFVDGLACAKNAPFVYVSDRIVDIQTQRDGGVTAWISVGRVAAGPDACVSLAWRNPHDQVTLRGVELAMNRASHVFTLAEGLSPKAARLTAAKLAILHAIREDKAPGWFGEGKRHGLFLGVLTRLIRECSFPDPIPEGLEPAAAAPVPVPMDGAPTDKP